MSLSRRNVPLSVRFPPLPPKGNHPGNENRSPAQKDGRLIFTLAVKCNSSFVSKSELGPPQRRVSLLPIMLGRKRQPRELGSAPAFPARTCLWPELTSSRPRAVSITHRLDHAPCPVHNKSFDYPIPARRVLLLLLLAFGCQQKQALSFFSDGLTPLIQPDPKALGVPNRHTPTVIQQIL